MKPDPLESLNHFTLPLTRMIRPPEIGLAAGPPQENSGAKKNRNSDASPFRFFPGDQPRLAMAPFINSKTFTNTRPSCQALRRADLGREKSKIKGAKKVIGRGIDIELQSICGTGFPACVGAD
jgi:hypothetical protein